MIVLKIEQCNFLTRKKPTLMEKPILSLKSVNIFESYGSIGYYQILLILPIQEAFIHLKGCPEHLNHGFPMF